MSTAATIQSSATKQSDQQLQKVPQSTLSTKNLFKHYFLLHDFFLRLVKGSSSNAKYFDLQVEVNDSMKKAASVGGKVGQIGMFGFLFIYCMKGRSIKLKMFSGFLYMYWIDHIYTFGAYTGILLRMPSTYSKVAEYFLNNEPLSASNPFLMLSHEMATNEEYEQTQQILRKIFRQEKIEQKTYMVNEYFAKNRERYFSEEEGTLVQKPSMKLKYCDCFLTRYVYYTFTRWCHKKLNSYGLGGDAI